MELGWKGVALVAMGMAIMCLLGIAPAIGHAGPEQQKPQLAEDVFKNVLVLKGISVNEFMDTMGFFATSLSLNCTDCHGEGIYGDKARFADDTPLKQTTRKMILMVTALNKNNFGGVREVTCYTCHRGDEKPAVRPTLAAQYAAPPPEDPDEVEIRNQDPGEPSADQIFDKYIKALGGAQALANLTSFVGKGTYEGYDTVHQKVPVDVFAKAPSQRTIIIHTPGGDSITTYDGHAGWIAVPDNVVPLMTLTGGDLDGAKMDATLSFPARVKQIRTQWRVGTATIDDHDVEVAEGTGSGQTPVKLYFDKNSGLLVRMVRYINTMVGQVTTQVDYSDYRAVSGVKMPFKWIATWVDGQTTIELSNVLPNVPTDAAKFAKPTVAPPKPARQ